MRVVINEWVPVGMWSWKHANGEVCGICRVQLEGTCPGCQFPGPACPPVVGKCTHLFHQHCILKWLDVSYAAGLCPMCRQPWTIEGEELNGRDSISGNGQGPASDLEASFPSNDISLEM